MKLARITKLHFNHDATLYDLPTINAALRAIEAADKEPYSKNESSDGIQYAREVNITVNSHKSVEAHIDQFTVPHDGSNRGWTEEIKIEYHK